jgi:hypothetical protein
MSKEMWLSHLTREDGCEGQSILEADLDRAFFA